jgi:hypothetical protein
MGPRGLPTKGLTGFDFESECVRVRPEFVGRLLKQLTPIDEDYNPVAEAEAILAEANSLATV